VPEVEVARLSELRDGEGAVVRVGDLEVALFRVGGEVHALANACLHLGAPIGDGYVEDGCAVCPWHGWRYDLGTGVRRPPLFDLAVPTYAVRVVDGRVMLDVDGEVGS
jgi:nitrite reductase/ring-hydroxylating ferredoxin subunit